MARPEPTPEQALSTGRVVWAALLLGPLAFGVVVLGLLPPTAAAGSAFPSPLDWTASAATLVLVPTAYLLRGRVWARGTAGGVVAPRRWLAGSLLCWALCEGTSFLGLAAVMLGGPSLERLAPPAAAFLAQVLAVPRAGPLGLGAR